MIMAADRRDAVERIQRRKILADNLEYCTERIFLEKFNDKQVNELLLRQLSVAEF